MKNSKNWLLGGVILVFLVVLGCSGSDKKKSGGGEGGGNTNTEVNDNGGEGNENGENLTPEAKFSVTFYLNKADAGSGENHLENPAPQSVAENAMASKVDPPSNFTDSSKTNASAGFTGLPDGQEDKIFHNTWVNIEDGEVWNFTQNKVDKNLKLYAKIFPKIEVASADARKYPTNPTYPTNKDAGFADEADENANYFAYFDGWFKTEDDSSWEFNQDSSKDLTLYGKWRETEHRPANKQQLEDLLYPLDLITGKAKINPQIIDTSLVTDMSSLFSQKSSFDDPIGGWNTGEVTEMNSMFYGASEFNRPIGGWNTALVTNMVAMFNGASRFNQPIGNWNTEGIQLMGSMFLEAEAFNQDLSDWKVGNVKGMIRMFEGARDFVQNMSSWNWKPTCTFQKKHFIWGGIKDMFKNSGIEGQKRKYPLFYKELEGAPSDNTTLKSLNSKNCTPHY